MKKIVFIGHEPLTQRIKEIFYIDDYRARNIEVEYWDMSQYFFPGISLPEELNELYIRKIFNIEELKQRLLKEDTQKIVFIVEIFDCWKNRSFFRLLSDMKCEWVRIDMYANTTIRLSFWEKLKVTSIYKYGYIINNHIKNIGLRFYKHFYHVQPYNKYFSSSAIIPDRIAINHPDYEKFRAKCGIDKMEKHIVFLDEFFPFHPDMKYMLGEDCSYLGKTYQETMTHFFDVLKKKYHLPVVVAAHPKSNYKGSEFGKVAIIKGKTDELVREAAFVVLHISTSLTYALLNDKPILLITTKEYQKVLMNHEYQKILGKLLNKPILNINKFQNEEIPVEKVDNKLREGYISDYLTSKECCASLNADIIIKHLALNKIS